MCGSKAYGAIFFVRKGDPAVIPAAIDHFVSEHPEMSYGSAVMLSTYAGKRWDKDTPSTEKTYFWWRLLY